MKITKVKVSKFEKDKLKGFATIEFESSFVVKNVKIMEGNNGLFVAMPSAKNGKGEYSDVCYPCTKEMREVINAAVLGEYHGQAGEGFTEVENTDDLPFK